ncbi:MAG: hypothetical protein WCI42_00145 [Verrucomicrobiota bacterium]
MKPRPSPHKRSRKIIHKLQSQYAHNGQSKLNGQHHDSDDHDLNQSFENEPRPCDPPAFPIGYQIKVICIYPSITAGKMARRWMDDALGRTAPHTSCCIEYYNYAVLSHDGISWQHVINRILPDIILMIGDGTHSLSSGLRHSIRELISTQNGKSKPLVIFRDLEPQPSINTRVLLDYVSAISSHNHCELNAMNGNGDPISCFRHPRLLLKARKHHE